MSSAIEAKDCLILTLILNPSLNPQAVLLKASQKVRMSPMRPYFLKLSSLPRFQTQHFQRWFFKGVCVCACMCVCAQATLRLCWLDCQGSSQAWLKVMLVISCRQRKCTTPQLMWQTDRFSSSHMIQSTANYKQCVVSWQTSVMFSGSATMFCKDRKESDIYRMSAK